MKILNKKFICIFYLCLLSLILIYHKFVSKDSMEWTHYAAIFLTLINVLIYLINWPKGIIFTSILIILGFFNLITYNFNIVDSRFSFFVFSGEEKIKISTPNFNINMVLAVFLFVIFNTKTFIIEIKKYYKTIKLLFLTKTKS
jgi:hypothetical protein